MKKRKMIVILICIILAILTIINIKISIFNESSNSKQAMSNTMMQVNIESRGLVVYANNLYSDTTDEDKINQNTTNLQKYIDDISEAGGGIVHIPAGTYYFASGGVNTRGVEEYVIKCKNNVTIEGEGTDETNPNKCTILKPYGKVTRIKQGGLDMFYFNDYRDYKTETYLENADFRNFIIDSEETEGIGYNSSGKGFMFLLVKNCDYENIVVKNTDGTGFGMDAPINCTIKNCIAINCGKAANSTNVGASGFGIGTGYSNEESIHISNCTALGNKKFGFFFEHQGRFGGSGLYPATTAQGFVVSNCTASGNMYDFGAARGNDVTYENCTSNYSYTNPNVTNISSFNFENMSRRIHIANCKVEQKFTDVNSSKYYYAPVYWALNNAITHGASKTTFSPEQACTRAQAIELIWRMAERPGEVVYGSGSNLSSLFENLYEDVPSTASYVDSVKWAKDEGILDGTSTKFLPEEECTRAEFIMFLWKYAGSPIVETEHDFTDIESGTEYEKAVNWAVDKEIISGRSQGQFLPNASCKRAEIVTFLYRFSNSNNDFNITYNYGLKSSGGKPANPTKYKAGESTFTLKNPTKVGYTFNGWTGSNYTENIDKNNYIPEKTVQITTSDRGNKVYTANWTPNKYTISFNANGGTGKMDDEYFTYDVPQLLSKNKFTKEGYHFKEWNTKIDGRGSSYSNGQVITNLSEKNENITLYAQWEYAKVNYRVEHYKQKYIGGVTIWDENNPDEIENFEGEIGTEVTPEPKTYEGFETPDKKTVTIEADGSAVIKYYYTRKQYELTIEKGNHVQNILTAGGSYIFGELIKISAVAEEGYMLKCTEKLTNTEQDLEFYMPAKDLTLLVEGEKIPPNTYTITYNLNGGNNNAENPKTYTPETEAIILEEPTKEGYMFTGWTGSNGETPQKTVTISKGSTGNKEYTANWSAIQYEMKYDPNAPDNTTVSGIIMQNSTHVYDEPKNLTKCTWEISNYTFKNWNTKKDGSGITYKDEQQVINLANKESSVVTLYAQWKKSKTTYTVEHYKETLEDGEYKLADIDENLTATIGDSVTPTTKEYKGFTAVKQEPTEIAEDGSTIIKCYYSRNSYTVTIEKEVGIESITVDAKYKFEQTVTLETELKQGYENVEWTITPEVADKSIAASGTHSTYEFKMPANDVSVEASATPIEYTITYNLDGGTATGNPTTYNIESEDITLKAPTKVGYTFIGWTGSNGSIAVTTVTITKGTTGNKTYTANWEAQEVAYKVEHYKANIDGTYTIVSADTENGTAKVGTIISPEPKAYEGFVTPEKQTVTVKADGSTVIRYNYERELFSITANALKGTENMQGVQKYKFGEQVTLSVDIKQGYQKANWQIAVPAENFQQSTTGNKSTCTFDMPAENVLIEVAATPIEYTITYDLDGGTVTGNPTTYNVESEDITLRAPTKAGDTFIGWTGSNGNTASTIVTIAKGSIGDKTYKANWKGQEVAYRVEHYKQDIHGNYPTQPTETESFMAIPGTQVAPEPKKYEGMTAPSVRVEKVKADGSTVIKYNYTRNSYTVTVTKGKGIERVQGEGDYKFEGPVTLEIALKKGYENIRLTVPMTLEILNTSEGTETTPAVYSFTMPAKNVSISAVATAIQYGITYNLGGGQASGNPTKYTIEDEITLKEPVKEGYIFLGWTGEGITTPQKIVTIPKGTTGNKTYTAHWEVNESNKLEVTVSYSETKPTNKNVVATITSNTKMEPVEGWTLSADKMSMTKEYEKNGTYNVEIFNEYGSKAEAEVKISNIDKIAPKVTVEYKVSENGKEVTVTLKADEELQEIEGWYTKDNITFIKVYEKNGEEKLVLKDLAGNEIEKTITVDKIKENNDPDPSNPGNNEEPANPSNPDKPNGGKDNTTTDKEIPKAGLKTIVTVVVSAVLGIGIVSFKKYRQYKDV